MARPAAGWKPTCGEWRGAMLSASVPLGILVGWLRRGRLGNLARLDARAAGVVAGAFLIRFLLYRSPGAAASPALLLAAEVALYGGIFAAVAMHRRLRGAWLVGLGGGANLVAILHGGGRMPVWTAALGRLDANSRAALAAGRVLTHVAMAQPRGLGWLGDVIALPAPLPAQVLSIGDVVLICGVVAFVASAMTAEPEPRRG
jgi:hypothetical protein